MVVVAREATAEKVVTVPSAATEVSAVWPAQALDLRVQQARRAAKALTEQVAMAATEVAGVTAATALLDRLPSRAATEAPGAMLAVVVPRA